MTQARTFVRATVKSDSAHFLTVDLGCQFALPSRRAFRCFFAVDFLDCSSRLLSRVCSLKELFGVTRPNAKKSATHKQIGAAEASSPYGWAVSWGSFINRDGPDLIELFSGGSWRLCLKYVIGLIDIRLATISSGSTPFKST
jgi:hypothetical protein